MKKKLASLPSGWTVNKLKSGDFYVLSPPPPEDGNLTSQPVLKAHYELQERRQERLNKKISSSFEWDFSKPLRPSIDDYL